MYLCMYVCMYVCINICIKYVCMTLVINGLNLIHLANMLVSGRFLMSGAIVPLQNKLVGGSTKFKQFITNTIQA